MENNQHTIPTPTPALSSGAGEYVEAHTQTLAFPPDLQKRLAQQAQHVKPTPGMPVVPTAAPTTQSAPAPVSPDALPVTLPSNFIPYHEKSLHIKRPLGLHQAKFNAASRTGSLKTLVEAIDSLMVGMRAFDLTPPDFTWVLYHIRQNNYVHKKFTHVGACNNAEHIKEFLKGTKSEDSLTTLVIVDKTTLSETALSDETRATTIEVATHFATLGLTLEHPKMSDMIEISDLLDGITDEREREETEWLLNRACLLSRTAHGPLESRRALIEATSEADLAELERFQDAVMSYGVNETITINCKECGAEIVTKVTISASSFL